MMDVLDQFLQSISYKFPKGYPDMTDPNHRDRDWETHITF